jgi:hypothetical protein
MLLAFTDVGRASPAPNQGIAVPFSPARSASPWLVGPLTTSQKNTPVLLLCLPVHYTHIYSKDTDLVQTSE